jgi:hypothetical protein
MMWEVIYWVLLVIALVVLGRGLLWDRAGFRGRPKRRCRRCWYDLTGVDGDVSREAVLCPECGKAHKTKRSMRKTRRGKRWVVAGVIIFTIGYGFRVAPVVRERGVWASAPSWVLILGIHRTPRAVDQTMPKWSSIAYGDDTALQRAMRELQVRARMDKLGWFDYQLTAWMARLETEELLCRASSEYGGASPRASGYCWILTRGIQRGKLGQYHSNWYRSLSVATVEVRKDWPEKAKVYGRVSVVFAKNDNQEWNDDPWFYKLRVQSGWTSFYRRHPTTVGWDVDLFPLGGRRNTQVRDDAGEWIMALGNKVWDDGLVPLRASSKSGLGEAKVEVYRTDGLSGYPFDQEVLINEHHLEFSVNRAGQTSDYLTIIDDEEVRDEIERCLEAEGRYWYDMDGRWHAAFRLKLIDEPNLGRRRYTFGGSQIRSISQQEELAGQAWWALNPVGDTEWELVHEGEYVLMYGWADETIDPGPYGHINNLSIKADPKFCLRDEKASLVVDGRIRLKVDWKQVQVHVN